MVELAPVQVWLLFAVELAAAAQLLRQLEVPLVLALTELVQAQQVE